MIQFKAKDHSGEIYKSALSPFTFPAGEAHTKREDRRELAVTEIAVIYGSPDMHSDLFQLAMWSDYIRKTAPRTKRVLVLPYVPGARADRGVPFGLAIYADFINNLHLDQIVIFDPHSPETIGQLSAWSDLDIVYPAEILGSASNWEHFQFKYKGVVAPDAGARNRAADVCRAITGPRAPKMVSHVNKTRDFETGKLTGFEVPADIFLGRWLLVDDICDGGGTFAGILDKMHTMNVPVKTGNVTSWGPPSADYYPGTPNDFLDLYVSHGVFSGDAFYKLRQFGTVYTTNSYEPNKQLPDRYVRLDVISTLLKRIK